MLKAGGNPIATQQIVDRINDSEKPLPPTGHDSTVDQLNETLAELKEYVSKIDSNQQINTSDKKKMLTMPFFLSKRAELPEPKFGQKEWDLFTKMYGTLYDDYSDAFFDEENKITEFNFENYLPERIANEDETISTSFKNEVKYMNLMTSTKYEQHKANQEEFRKLMPIISQLTEEEAEIFVHMIQNKKAQQLNNDVARSETLVDDACSNEMKEKLAKISEDENFALKNTWRFNKTTMAHADKKKMPVDKRKVSDLLRHQNIFKAKIINELDTYFQYQNNPQFENGLLTYVNEASYGDMKELLLDVGISRHSTPFMNVAEFQKMN